MLKKNPFCFSRVLLMCTCITASFFVGGCDSGPATELTPQQQLLRSGNELFAQKCASCHGSRGNGMGGRSGPALNGKDYRYGNGREAVLKSIRDGREEGMPGFSSALTETQLEALTEYVVYLKK